MGPGLPNDAKSPKVRDKIADDASVLDALCRIACSLFAVPWALIRLNDETCYGIPASGDFDIANGRIARSLFGPAPSLQETLVIEDAACAPRFAENPFVSGSPFIRFCAGASLFAAPDTQAGVLCLFDILPRRFRPEECRQFEELAQIASAHLTLQAALREASEGQALHRLLAENSTDTIVRGNLDGVRLYISPAVRTLLGYEPEELVGRKAMEIVHPDDAAAFAKLMQDVRESRIDLSMSEQRQRHRDGHWVWLEAFVKLTRDKRGEADGYVASVRDISRRKEAELRLAHIASHDALTGLPNRTLLHERLSQEISRAMRAATGFALFCLDLDRFKPVNDAFGHEAGDAVLRVVAGRLRFSVRAEDTVARIGGDEFAVIQIVDGGRPASAIKLADRLIRAVSEPIDVNGTFMNVGLSIGIVFAPLSGVDAEGLLKAADAALYKAKEAGRYRYSIFEAAPGAMSAFES